MREQIVQNMGNVGNIITIFFAGDKDGLNEQAIGAGKRQSSAKQRVIDTGLFKLHNVATAVNNLIAFIEDNRHKDSADVDGKKLIAYEEALYYSCDTLLNEMDVLAFDEFVRAVTGRSTWELIIEAQIEAGEGDYEFWQREIKDIAKRDPLIATELQRLLNERLVVV